jgi:hypothetical protein
MPFGRHRTAKPKLVAKKFHFLSSPRFLRPPVALYNKAAIRSGKLVSRWTQGADTLESSFQKRQVTPALPLIMLHRPKPLRARLSASNRALTPKAVRLRHLPRVAERVRSARMLVMQEDGKLQSYGFTLRRHRLLN